MQRAEVAEEVAKMMKQWHYSVREVGTATFQLDSNGHLNLIRGLHKGSKAPYRAIQIHVDGPAENLEKYLLALKDRLRDIYSEVKIRYHPGIEFIGADQLYDRIRMLRGRNQNDLADQLERENTVHRPSILIFSKKPFRRDVFDEACRRVKAVFQT